MRRKQILVGQEIRFDCGREPMALPAGLELTAKSVEAGAESIGADIGRREQEKIGRALQRDLPIFVGEAVPRRGEPDSLAAHTREARLGCAVTPAARLGVGAPAVSQ